MVLNDKNPYDDFFKKEPKITKPLTNMLGVARVSGATLHGINTGFGDSKYDAELNWGSDIDQNDVKDSINEYRADNQSGGAQLGLGVARATTKALTEVAKLPGVVGGIISAPFAKEGEGMDTAFNNWWIKGLEGFNDKINTDILPVYTAKAVREGNLWDNISSTSFWATDGADGIGFIAAMMAPGAIFEYAGLGSKMIQGLAKSSRLAGMVEKTEAGVNVLKGLGITGRNIDSGLAIAGNTIFEAGAEAKGVGDDLDRKKPEFIKQYVQKYLVELSKTIPQYIEVPGTIVTGIDGLQHGTLPHREINPEYQNIQNKALELAENDFKNQRALAMRNTFVSNVGILLGPNAIMHKAIWGKAAQKFEKITDSALKRVGKSAGRIGSAFASEGLWEEGSQTTVENMFVNKAMKNQLGKDNDFNIGDFTKEYINTLSTTEGQKAIFLGGILGGPIMSYQGRKEDIRNRNNTNAVLAGINSEITNFNNVFDTNVYKTNEDGSFIYEKDKEGNDTTKRQLDGSKVAEVAKSLNFTEQQSQIFDLAVEQGNTEVVETLKQQAIFNMILPAIHNGEMGIQALEQQLNENTKFQEILEKDKTSDEKEKSKTFVKETLDTAKYLQKQNEKFQDFSKDVIELKNDKATPEQKQEFLNKLNSSYLNVKHQIKQDEKLLKDLQSKKASILEESNLENNLQTEDEVLINEEKNNPLLKDINDKIRKVEKTLNKSKRDIADIWKGTDKIEGTFNDYIQSKNKLQEETSAEKEQEYQVILDKINNATTKDDLKGIKSNNAYVNEKLQEKIELLEQLNEIKKQEELAAQLAAQQEFENDPSVEVTTKPVITTPTKVDNSTEGAENHEELVETPSKNMEGNETPSNLGHAKLISTNRDTGQKLDFISQQFLDYERTPINKVGNEVFISINNEVGSTNKNWTNAISILNNKNFTKENIEFLIEHLPININISDNVFAPIETQPKGAKAQEVFNDSSKILRTLIVNELVKGTNINDIKVKILGQFPGNLTVEDEVLENSILELDAVQKNLVDINKNIFMINSQKDKQFSDGKIEPFVNSDINRVNGVGEIYLNIPQANGQIYPLKLNIRKLNRTEAEVIADIFEYRLNSKTGKDTLIVNTPQVLQDSINTNLKEVLSILTSKGKKNKDITIKDIIDFLIWDGTSNKKSMVKLSGTGIIGETVLKFGDNIAQTLDPVTKDKFINWLVENKRHNIKFKAKKNESNQDKIDINDKVYLDYLLSSKTLNTNAVVNQPTFQGYANIYLENNISVSGNEVKGVKSTFVKPEKEKFSDIEDKKSDIERRRQEEKVVHTGTDKKGRKHTYFSTTTEKDGVTKTKFTFNRSDKDSTQRNTANVPTDIALGDKYTIPKETKNADGSMSDQIPENSIVYSVLEIREKDGKAAATVMFQDKDDPTIRWKGDIVLEINAKIEKENIKDSNPIIEDYSPYSKQNDGENLYYGYVNNDIYYASDKSGRVFKAKNVDVDNLKGIPKADDIYGELVTDNEIINEVQQYIRNIDDMFGNPNLLLNNYENNRNSQNNFVSLHEIPNTTENKELLEAQKSNNVFTDLSEEKQSEVLKLLQTKLKGTVSLLKDKQYLNIVKEKNSQKLYKYLTQLAKDNELDIEDIEKHCK